MGVIWLPCSNVATRERARPGRLLPGGRRERVPWPPPDALCAADGACDLVATDHADLVASDACGDLVAMPEPKRSCQPCP